MGAAQGSLQVGQTYVFRIKLNGALNPDDQRFANFRSSLRLVLDGLRVLGGAGDMHRIETDPPEDELPPGGKVTGLKITLHHPVRAQDPANLKMVINRLLRGLRVMQGGEEYRGDNYVNPFVERSSLMDAGGHELSFEGQLWDDQL